MKLFISKLDNGYTLTVTHPDNRKERFAFEGYPQLAQKIDNFLLPEAGIMQFDGGQAAPVEA